MMILDEGRVYAVLEYHNGKNHDERLHGVYTTREIADRVAAKIVTNPKSGYVCVLKQKVQGPTWTLSYRRIKNGKN